MKFIRKTPVLETFLNTVAWPKTCSVIKKKTPTKVFSCKYCEFFKTPIYFEDDLLTAASENQIEFGQSMQITQCVVKIY